ncbi:MAG: 3-dehydroquinate dehydratase [Frankiales bacterium]|nr:3-dehydroquinate dehydratase [Frankiales bacterium]
MREVAGQVEAANAALYVAFETGDIDLMEAVWDAEEPEALVCVHPGWPMLRGRANVLRSWSAVMAGTEYIQFLLTDVQVTVHGETALVTCTENVLTSADVGENAAVVTTNVFVRRQDGWKLLVHHGAPVLGRLTDE